MSFRRLYMLFFAATALLAAASCKKDDDDATYPSLDGALRFDIPDFVEPGQVVKMTPRGVRHPEGKELGYFWKVTPGMDYSDTTRLENGLSPEGEETDGSFTYTFSDSLGTYNVSAYAFAEGYSSEYESKYIAVVKGGVDGEGSLTGTGIKPSDTKITVDGIDYYYTQIAGLDWFRHNLANPAYGVPYSNDEAMSQVFGRYYSYEEAVKACPEGWRLPTDEEWAAMAKAVNPECTVNSDGSLTDIAAALMADIKMNKITLWEYWPEVGEITNASQLAIIPCGYSNLGEMTDGKHPNAGFAGIYEYSVFWTADKSEDDSMAKYRYIYVKEPGMALAEAHTQTFGASVRCVR